MKTYERSLLFALILSVVLSACVPRDPITATSAPTPIETILPTETSVPDAPTATATIYNIPFPTSTPTVSDTPEPTDIPGPTIDPSPTQIMPLETVSPERPNLLPCADMECEFVSVWVCDDVYGCSEHKVPNGSSPFFKDQPYTPDKQHVLRPCAPDQEWGCNPPELYMGRPEYKPTETEENEDGVMVSVYPYRVHSGIQAAVLFCMFRSCQAGWYYEVDTEPGLLCEVGAYVQSWSTPNGSLLSQLITKDDRDASMWRIVINKSGKTFAFLGENESSRWFGFNDGHYDKYEKISYQFTTNSYRTTIFIENLRIWRFGNQDAYLDSVYLRCNDP